MKLLNSAYNVILFVVGVVVAFTVLGILKLEEELKRGR